MINLALAVLKNPSYCFFRFSSLLVGLMVALLTINPVATRANVYATNLRLNGGTTNVSIPSGGNVSISFLLNEPATTVSIDIKSGATIARTITITNGPGTLRGTNTVTWNGKNDSGINVGGGAYSISITAAAAGFGDWMQTSDDFNDGNYVWDPAGISVNKNTNSFYYGRVFVANGSPGPHPGTDPGDAVGIQKLNSDGSPAAEGIFSTGGYPWVGDSFSPWKIEAGSDDRVYINNLSQQGIVMSFDQAITSNSSRAVFRSDNWPNSGQVKFSGPFLTSAGSTMQIWLADTRTNGVGIRRWDLIANGTVATNDLGITVVQAGASSDLNPSPYDVTVDRSNYIYTIQNRAAGSDPAYRVLRFPPYQGASETIADWKIGTGDDALRGASGIAVDTTASLVAVAFNDISSTVGVRIFDVATGGGVTALGAHGGNDVAWDNAGNLYVVDSFDSVWRVYSPPGTNQATTVALPFVQVQAAPIQPILSQPGYASGQFHFTLLGEANLSYIIQASTNLQAWAPVVTNTAPIASRLITVTAPASRSFYRALLAP
jgi:hypothetical protein